MSQVEAPTRRAGSPRRAVALALERLGVQRPAYRVWEWSRTLEAAPELVSRKPRTDSDGLALPPPILRVQVTGTAKPDEFLAQGQRSSEAVAEVARATGKPIEELDSVLDFGCGCGRVMRHWANIPGVQFVGSDYNPKLINWCKTGLPFGTFETNDLAPPLPFADGQFDLVYALSVFTHLTVPLQHQWMAELARVIKPGGRLVFTTRGEAWAWKLDDQERARYEAGEVIVRYEGVAGTNLCATFHPWSYVHERMSDSFKVLESFPARLHDGRQDMHVFERLA